VLNEYLTLVDDSCVAVLPHVLRIAAELKIADILSRGPLTTGELAAKTEADDHSLYRLLRALASVGLLEESRDRTFHLTAAGHRLRSDNPLGSWASIINFDSQMAWVRALDTIKSSRPAFDQAHGGEFFTHKDNDDGANRMFLRRMRERANRSYPKFAEAIDWHESSVVMDIGGGDGFLLEGLLDREVHLTGILFDRPQVIDVIDETGHLGRFRERFRAARGDFFQGIPAGADTHLLCSVLHDWTDLQATDILRHSRQALSEGGRLHIVEMLVPEGNSWHPSKWSDIGMMVLTGGRERTHLEFEKLLLLAGYKLASIRDIGNSHFSVITAT